MKFAFLLIIAAFSSSALCRAESPAVPDVVKRGFDAYLKLGVEAGFNEWLKGSPIEKEKTMRAQATGLANTIESGYGKFTGWELIRVVALSDSVRRVYAIAKYEKGPLYVSFDCYKAKDWIIPMFNLTTKASEILPPSMLGGQ